jgi:RNA polymerase sigma factor (sigma-70 family)
MTQNKLIEGCIKKNRTAQEDLYKQYKDTLFLLCLKYCRNRTEAEDNLHDAFITIFNKIDKYKNKGSFEGWLKRITINMAIDKYKKSGNTNEILDNLLVDDTTIEENKFNIPLQTILNTVQKLPNQYRMVFNLYELDNFSHREVSKLLNISIGTSKSNLHRSKLILKKNIEELNSSNLNKTNNNGS